MTCLLHIISHSIKHEKLFRNQVGGEGGTRTPDTRFRNSKENMLPSTAESVGVWCSLIHHICGYYPVSTCVIELVCKMFADFVTNGELFSCLFSLVLSMVLPLRSCKFSPQGICQI